MKIVFSIGVLWLFLSSVVFQNNEIRMDIKGNPSCLKTRQTYRVTFVFPENLKNITYRISAMNSTLREDTIPNKYFLKAGYPGKTHFVLSQYDSKTKKSTELKKFNFTICK